MNELKLSDLGALPQPIHLEERNGVTKIYGSE